MTARYVQKQSDEGVVAIPSNSNYWPTFNRDQALKLIQDHVGADYEIVKEKSVVSGQVTTTDQQTTETPMPTRNGQTPSGTQTSVSQTTRSADVTEWYIYYRKRSTGVPTRPVVPAGGATGPGSGVVPAAGTPDPVVPGPTPVGGVK
jgi:hypothetical protein